MTRDERYPPAARITATRDYDRVFDGGRKCVRRLLVLYTLRREDSAGETRLGRTVSRKVGNAIVRNRVRRRLREVFRLNRWRMERGWDIVVVARPAAAQRPAVEFDRDFLSALGEGGVLPKGDGT